MEGGWKGKTRKCLLFLGRGGTGSVSRVIYRHLTAIKGTCQSCRYWIPAPSMVSPYLSQVLSTPPFVYRTWRIKFSLLALPGILYSPNAFPFLSLCVSRWSTICELPISSVCNYAVVFSPITFHLSPISPLTIQWQSPMDTRNPRESRRPLKLAPPRPSQHVIR